jgi:hypothetical protein
MNPGKGISDPTIELPNLKFVGQLRRWYRLPWRSSHHLTASMGEFIVRKVRRHFYLKLGLFLLGFETERRQDGRVDL